MIATRQENPASGCPASKEELLNKKKNPLDIDDDCPICRDDYNVLCRVAKHPSRPLASVDGVNQNLELVAKNVNFLVEMQMEERKEKEKEKKKSKSGGSRASTKGYDKANYIYDRFEFNPLNEGFTLDELETIRENLYQIMTNIRTRLQEKRNAPSAMISSSSGDEIGIVQDEAFKLCDALCILYNKHYGGKECISFATELGYNDTENNNTSSSSSSVPNTATNKKGRIDFSFHEQKSLLTLSVGLLECKNTSKEIYANKDQGKVAPDGKKAIHQAFIQLKSQTNKLYTSMNVHCRLFVCILSTGRKWLVLRREYYNGESLFQSQEVELLSQDGTLVQPDSEELGTVTNMLFYLLFGIKKVNEDIQAHRERVYKLLHDGNYEDGEDDGDNGEDDWRDDDFDESGNEEHKDQRDKREKKRKLSPKQERHTEQKKKKKNHSGPSDSWKYAPFTVENLIKHQQLIK